MAKKTTIQRLRAKNDKLLQEINRLENLYCEVCGKPTQVGHHYVPKSISNRLRYDLNNIIPLCNGCHMRHHQAGDPNIHYTAETKRGKKWCNYIIMARQELVKADTQFYKDARDRLQARRDKLELDD